MAIDGDGHLAEPGRKGRGKGNGKGINGYANGHAAAPKPKANASKLKKRRLFGIPSTVSRFFIWYIILTVLFRCPSTPDLVTDTSPKACKPYFQLKSIVSPHLEPYYQTYAAPYVEVGRPYYETVDQRIIAPAVSLGKRYGAPLAAQAQTFGQTQWEKNVQPQVLKYTGVAKEKYDQTLGPHVEKIVASGTPYYEVARTNAFQTYYGHILPTYKIIQPYIIQTYDISSRVAVNTVIPYSKWAWTTSVVFLDRTVWPKVRILYGENVEPQLVRIGERLGRYRDGKKLKAVPDEVNSSPSVVETSQVSSTIKPSTESVPLTDGPSTTPTTPSPPSVEVPQSLRPSEAEIREKAQSIVANDLQTWQEKFAKAADDGSDELEERVTDITEELIKEQAFGVGNTLVVELDKAVKSSLETLRDSIISIVKASKDTKQSEETLATAVRKAGVEIKQKAQAVRTWRQTFDRETNEAISAAAFDTFEILDHIRDLGLQEIGMRWAWTDGITHKDWAKYHKLKRKFDEWRVDVEAVVLAHPGLTKSRAASENVENTAMTIAEEAAKELARLKETGRWKISAGDASDDFSTKHMPEAAAPAEHQEQKVVDNIESASVAAAPSSQGTVESVTSAASEVVADAISLASSAAASQINNAQSIASAGSSSASSLVDPAPSSEAESEQGSVESISYVAKASGSSVVDQASSSVIEIAQDTTESLIPVVAESVSSESAEVSSSIHNEGPGIVEKASDSIKSAASAASNSASSLSDAANSSVSAGNSVVSSALSEASSSLGSATSSIASSLSEYSEKEASSTSSTASSAASSASSASKKVMGGAMAQSVKASEIVYEDVIEDSTGEPSITSSTSAPATEFIASQASQVYSDALSRASERYSQARSIVSAHVSGEPKPIHEEMFSSINIAYSDSVAAASSRLSSAVAAASTAVYGVPPGALESLLSVAQSRLSDGLSAASSRFQEGKDYVAATPTNAPQKQKLLLQLQEQYYAGVGMAHARYSEFVDAASSAVLPTPTPTPTYGFEGALSTAEALYSSALAGASSQLGQALSAIPKAGGSAKEAVPTSGLAAAASQKYSAVVAEASSSYSSASSAIASKIQAGASKVSTAVVGSETPLTESVASRASENWESLITRASSQIYGAPTPDFLTKRLFSEAKEYGAQVTDAAASQYSAVQSLVSELVSGKEPDFTESVYNKLSSVYYTGAAVAASTASSVASEALSSAQSKISSAIHGTEQGALESAQSKLSDSVESAKSRLAEFAASAGEGAQEYLKHASEGVDGFASSASSVIGAATTSVKDEL